MFVFILECVLQKRKDSFWLFVFASLLGVMMSSVLFLPQTYQMMNQGAEGQLSGRPRFNTSFIGAWKDLFLNDTYLTGGTEKNPPLFVGSLPIVLIVAGLYDRQVKWREKLIYSATVLIGMLSLNFNSLNRMFTIFHAPNSHFFRHSFLMSFALLMVAAYMVKNKISRKATGLACVTLVAICVLYNITSQKMPIYVLMISIISIVLSAVVVILINYIKKPQVLIAIVLPIMCLLCVEYIYNWKFQFQRYGLELQKIQEYDAWKTEIMDEINNLDDGVYRVENAYTRHGSTGECTTEAMGFGYYGISSYSSTVSQKVGDLLIDLGNTSHRRFSMFDSVPLSDSLFGIKYAVSDKMLPMYDEITHREDEGNIYYNPNAASIGYRIVKDDNNRDFGENVFDNQEMFLEDILGQKYNIYSENTVECMKKITADNARFKVTINSTGPVYIYTMCSDSDIKIYVDGQSSQNIIFYNNNIRYIGDYEEGSVIEIVAENESKECDIYCVSLNEDSCSRALAEVKEHQLQVTEMRDGYIKGRYDALTYESVLMTVPYERGWTIKVNNKKVPGRTYRDTFLVFDLEPGINDIEMKYHTPLSGLGIILSIISIALCILYESHKVGISNVIDKKGILWYNNSVFVYKERKCTRREKE